MKYKIIIFLAVVIGGEALAVMYGWIFHVDWLTRFLPDGINMKFPTALLLFVSAIGLYVQERTLTDVSEWPRVILPGIAFFLLIVPIVLFLAGIFRDQTGIENLFVEPNTPLNASGSGWPAISSLLFFVMFGLSCIFALFPGPNQRKIIFFLGVFISAFGIIALLGYLLHVPAWYYQFTSTMTPIALNTACSFAILGAGLSLVAKKETAHEI